MTRIVGFEFLIAPVGSSELSWVRLQGSGGEIGAGSLAAINDARSEALRASLTARVSLDSLKRAQMEARTTGAVRVSRDHEDPAQRIISTRVLSVAKCRPVYEAMRAALAKATEVILPDPTRYRVTLICDCQNDAAEGYGPDQYAARAKAQEFFHKHHGKNGEYTQIVVEKAVPHDGGSHYELESLAIRIELTHGVGSIVDATALASPPLFLREHRLRPYVVETSNRADAQLILDRLRAIADGINTTNKRVRSVAADKAETLAKLIKLLDDRPIAALDAPWPCGHNDPIFHNHTTQRCAICGAARRVA